MKTYDFLTNMKLIRCGGGDEEERAYYQDKFTIKIFEGALRNPIAKKLKQVNGTILIV